MIKALKLFAFVILFANISFITNAHAQGACADSNQDGTVDVVDLITLLSQWGTSCDLECEYNPPSDIVLLDTIGVDAEFVLDDTFAFSAMDFTEYNGFDVRHSPGVTFRTNQPATLSRVTFNVTNTLEVPASYWLAYNWQVHVFESEASYEANWETGGDHVFAVLPEDGQLPLSIDLDSISAAGTYLGTTRYNIEFDLSQGGLFLDPENPEAYVISLQPEFFASLPSYTLLSASTATDVSEDNPEDLYAQSFSGYGPLSLWSSGLYTQFATTIRIIPE